MTETLRDKLIRCGWVTDFNADTLVRLIERHYAALAQPEPEGLTDEEIDDQFFAHCYTDDFGNELMEIQQFRKSASAVLARWGRPAIEPVPVSERFEFSVFDSEYEEQAGGTAPTYSQALSEGQHYLAMYSQDGPHSLEIRRVEVLPHHALPVPNYAALAQPEPQGPSRDELRGTTTPAES